VTGQQELPWLSRPAVLWAMDDAPGVPPGGLPARLRYPLVAVARYADEDGRGAYPSAAEVARIIGKSESQAQRDVAALLKLGLLLPGDAALVKHIRADRRPNVYDLPMPRGAPGRTPSGRHGVHPDAPRQAVTGSHGTTPRGSTSLRHGARPDDNRTIPEQSRTAPPAPPRARDPRTILAGLGATGEEAEAITTMLEGDPAIRDPYLWLLGVVGNGNGPSLLQQMRRDLAALDRPPQQPPKPPWCGQCDPDTRLTGDPDHPARCLSCHPLSLQPPAEPAPSPAWLKPWCGQCDTPDTRWAEVTQPDGTVRLERCPDCGERR
jgi:hypothetical protein